MTGNAKQVQTEGPRPSAVVRADAAQRAQRAWTARVSGSTWDEAAQLAGYADAATACRGVKNYLGALPVVERDDLRDLWRQRMELLWSYAARDAETGRPGALRAGTAIAQRAAAMDGLDAPTNINLTTVDAGELGPVRAPRRERRANRRRGGDRAHPVASASHRNDPIPGRQLANS